MTELEQLKVDIQVEQEILDHTSSRLNALLDRIKELEEKEAKVSSTERWIPKDGEAYFFVGGDGGIRDTANNMDSDRKRIAQMNAFKTQEEAEKERDIRQIWYELRQFAKEWNAANPNKEAVYTPDTTYNMFNNHIGAIAAGKHFGDRLNLLNF